MNNKRIDVKNKLDSGQRFKISRFREKIKKTHPHKHDEYYELIFLEQGEGFHTIETEKFRVEAPDFYLLKPGQLHYWQFTSIPKGFVVLFKENEFDSVKESILIDLLRKISERPRIKLENDSSCFVLLNELEQEYQKNAMYSKEIIHGLVKVLMGKVLQMAHSEPARSSYSPTSFDRFQQLLVSECPRLRKVHEFADALNMTPQNLNAICRRYGGKSASELIHAQLLLEAKRYILHTDYTVNEIAEMLFFSDTSNFVKFFRKNEGITPIQFRSKYFQ